MLGKTFAVVAASVILVAGAAHAGETKAPLRQLPVSGTWINPCANTRVDARNDSSGGSSTGGGWAVRVSAYDNSATEEWIGVKDQAEAAKVRDLIASMRNDVSCTDGGKWPFAAMPPKP